LDGDLDAARARDRPQEHLPHQPALHGVMDVFPDRPPGAETQVEAGFIQPGDRGFQPVRQQKDFFDQFSMAVGHFYP